MFLNKIKELEQKEKELQELPEVVSLNKIIEDTRIKLNEIKKPYEKEIDTLSDEIDEFIIKRLKLLNLRGYKTQVHGNSNYFGYYIENDNLCLNENSTYWNETQNYYDEIPLHLFTCSDDKVVSFCEMLKNQKEEYKLRKQKEAALAKLKEIEEYEKATGIKIKNIRSI